MSVSDELRQVAETIEAREGRRSKHPKGWEPGITWEGDQGTITTRPSTNPEPQWEDELRSWGFDPDLYEVIEPVNFRTWEMWGGHDVGKVQLTYYKANIRTRTRGVIKADAEELLQRISRYKKPKREAPDGKHAFVYVIADTQLGKEGSDETVDRWLGSIGQAEDRVRDLRKLGVDIGEIYILGLGDIVEGCDGWYAMQAFSVEYNRRDQVKASYRLVERTIRGLANLAPKVGVLAVGGNHGENRKKGKAFTDFADNDDLLVFEMAYDIVASNQDAFGHVSARFPGKDLTMAVDIAGTAVGLAHGHQAKRGGAKPQAKIEEWWKNQMFGRRPVGDVDLLVTGHYHHLTVIEDGHRTWIQAPALDSGSQWWEETMGRPTHPGVLTFTLDPRGVDNMKVLRGS